MKKLFFLLISIFLLFPSITFSQEKLDQATMNEFYSGFQNAANTNQYYKARLISAFSQKFNIKDLIEMEAEMEKVAYDFDHQVVVFNEIYTYFNWGDRKMFIRSFLEKNYLLYGNTLSTVTEYIDEQKYLLK